MVVIVCDCVFARLTLSYLVTSQCNTMIMFSHGCKISILTPLNP